MIRVIWNFSFKTGKIGRQSEMKSKQKVHLSLAPSFLVSLLLESPLNSLQIGYCDPSYNVALDSIFKMLLRDTV